MKLKPCPFCGKTDQLVIHGVSLVECQRCEVSGPTGNGAWNRRPLEDDLRLCLDEAVESGGCFAV